MNNMQFFTAVTTIHGVLIKLCFACLGVGYMHSCRDKESFYPMYGAFRCAQENARLKLVPDIRLGIVYDPFWVRKV